MIDELGRFCLCLALVISVAQMACVIWGEVMRKPEISRLSQGLAVSASVSVFLAFLALIHAFVVSDFSVANVAQNSHTLKPMLYKVAGSWGSHEGSMLLWCTVLLVYGAVVALGGKHLPLSLKHKVLGVQGAMGALFLGFTYLTSNPLARLIDPPLEGHSLNPLLQDPALAFHPPMLYLGYVGFSVVFSFAVAALIEGRIDRTWARFIRPWTLIAWCFLTLGITLGAFWAYYELGWGGWWFWDPVENASFMPWLCATALLHSSIVMEKRQALSGWTVFLALLAFSFSMLGAFLVRSGVLTSVHAFAVDPKRGIVLLMILSLLSGLGFALFAWRVPQFKAGGLFAPISREAALVVNNILLSAALATVFLGTLYPILMESMTGKNLSVGAPYFLLTFVPLMSVAVVLLPLSLVLKWKRSDISASYQRFIPLLGLTIVISGLGFLAHGSLKIDNIPSLLFGLALGSWLILGSFKTLYERLEGFKSQLWSRFKALPRSFLGMSLAHIGLGLFILGATFETQTKLAEVSDMAPGQVLSLNGYQVKMTSVAPHEGPNYSAMTASLEITKPGFACSAKPERRFYPASMQTTSQIALCFTPLSDLYFVLGAAQGEDKPGSATHWQIRALYNPWVRLIFFGPLFMLLGGLVSLSDRHLRFGAPQKSLKPAKVKSA